MENSIEITKKIRKDILYMSYYSKASHIGSCLSIVDILYVLYWNIMNINPNIYTDDKRDKFILSKGHASAALYATLAEKGFFDISYLQKYYINDGILPGHLDFTTVPGIEISSGSLGHGLSIGVGMAISNSLDNNPGQIYILLGDGECEEGSVYEAAILAGTLKLNNLTVIIDKNGLQGCDKTENIISQKKLKELWTSFGWQCIDINGHNLEEIKNSLKITSNIPKAVIASTIKGKGISFMENKIEWHYKSPNKEQYELALKELEGLN